MFHAELSYCNHWRMEKCHFTIKRFKISLASENKTIKIMNTEGKVNFPHNFCDSWLSLIYLSSFESNYVVVWSSLPSTDLMASLNIYIYIQSLISFIYIMALLSQQDLTIWIKWHIKCLWNKSWLLHFKIFITLNTYQYTSILI